MKHFNIERDHFNQNRKFCLFPKTDERNKPSLLYLQRGPLTITLRSEKINMKMISKSDVWVC